MQEKELFSVISSRDLILRFLLRLQRYSVSHQYLKHGVCDTGDHDMETSKISIVKE